MTNNICRVQDFIPTPVLTIDDNGVAHGIARIARAGIYDYHSEELKAAGLKLPDGMSGWVKVFRPPEKIREAASIFDSCPVILNHEWLSPKNIDSLTKGWSAATDYVNGWLESPIFIFKQDAIKSATTTHKEFSSAYDSSFECSPGVWVDEDGIQGEKGRSYDYTFIQVPTKKNHIALVRNNTARAGSRATFMDNVRLFDSVLLPEEKLMDDVAIGMNGTTASLPQVIAVQLSELLEAIAEMVETLADPTGSVEMQIGDSKYAIPKSMKDMVARYADTMAKRGEKSVTDSSQYIHVDAYKQVEANLRQAHASISTMQLQNTNLKAQIADANDPAKLAEILAERSKIFDSVSPYLNGKKFDATIPSKQWKIEALVSAGTASAVLDSYDDGQIDAAFATLVATSPVSNPRRGVGSSQVTDAIMRYRETTSKAVVSANTNLPQNRAIRSLV